MTSIVHSRVNEIRSLVFGRVVLLIAAILALSLFPVSARVASPREPRTFSIRPGMLPKGVIEILKVEGLDSEDFLSDFAVEVKNVCQKPIYKITFYIDFLNCFPAAGQNRCGLMLCYSDRIFHKMELPKEGDKPILPGETVTIKFSPEESKGLREALKEGIVREGLFDKLSIWFQAANFGDGTGYHVSNFYDGRGKD